MALYQRLTDFNDFGTGAVLLLSEPEVAGSVDMKNLSM